MKGLLVALMEFEGEGQGFLKVKNIGDTQVPFFLFTEAFRKFLPFLMGFAAGCMIWMVVAEMPLDALEDASTSHVASIFIYYVHGISKSHFSESRQWFWFKTCSTFILSFFISKKKHAPKCRVCHGCML